MTLPRRAWDAVRRFLRWLGEFVRTLKQEILRLLEPWWERLGDLLIVALALPFFLFAPAWRLLRGAFRRIIGLVH